MLGKRQSRGQQPDFLAIGPQQLGDRGPFEVEQGLPARQEHHLSAELRKAGEQAFDRFEGDVVAAMPPVVTADAAGIAAIGQIQGDQG